jgi:hypothetical protein
MQLTAAIQQLLLEMDLPAEDMADIVLDAQEYGVGELVALVSSKLSPEDVIVLDEMIDEEKTASDIDAWLATKIADYDTYMPKALEEVKEYLASEVPDMNDADLNADE